MTPYIVIAIAGLIIGYLMGFFHSYLKCQNRIVDLYHAVRYLESQLENEPDKKGKV